MKARDFVYWTRILLGTACGSVFGALNLSGTVGVAAAMFAIPAVYGATTKIMQRYVKADAANFNVKTEGVFSFIILWLFFWTLLMNLLYPRL